MNKIWLRREKRRMNHQKENYDKQIRDLKRQLSHHQPYKKGIAITILLLLLLLLFLIFIIIVTVIIIIVKSYR
jgi:lipopolysaccharide/colanic/teichoic acid biosynthesis glycosyltransferase